MRKAIVAFAGVAVLAAWGPAMADLCGEKKAGLAKFEAEAPGLHAKVAELEAKYADALAVVSKSLTGATEGATTGMGGDLGLGLDVARFGLLDTARANADNLQKQLLAAKERERYVGNQIFLLRDIIEGLGCGAQTPAPPVDLNAINQFGEQSQLSGPGGTPQAGSGAFGGSVVPQGPYATPSSGFGPSSGSTQPADQQGQQPGYGPGPDTGSFKPPKYGEIQEKIQGSIGGEPGKPGMGKPGGG